MHDNLPISVGCRPAQDGGISVTVLGPFWSPGYNKLSGYGTYNAGMDCQWIMKAPVGLTISVTAYHFKTVDNDGVLVIKSNSGATLT